MANLMIIFMTFIHFLIISFPKELNVTFNKIDYTYGACSRIDSNFSSIVTKAGNIAFSGTTCSLIGYDKCAIIVFLFDHDFQILNKKILLFSHSSEANHLFETSDSKLFITSLVAANSNGNLTLIRLLSDLSDYDVLSLSIPQLTSNGISMEIEGPSAYYRVFFSCRLLTFTQVCYININAANFPTYIVNDLEHDEFRNSDCIHNAPLAIFYAGKIQNLYYYSGYCEGQYGFIIQYALDKTNFNYYISSQSSSVYKRIQSYDTNIIIASLDIKDSSNSLYSKFSILGIGANPYSLTYLSSTEVINTGNTKILPSIHDFVIINNDIYSFIEIYQIDSSNFILFDYFLNSDKVTGSFNNQISYPQIINSEFSYEFYPKNLNLFNNSILISSGEGQFVKEGNNFIIHFISPSPYGLKSSIIYGGEGLFYSNRNYEISPEKLLIFCQDGTGLYFAEVNITDLSVIIVNQGKLKLEFPIIQGMFLVKGDSEKIIIGRALNYQKIEYSFIANLNSLYFPLIIPSPSWLSNFLIYCATNLDSTSFVLAGSLNDTGILKCYYSVINNDFTLKIDKIIDLPGYSCTIKAMISSGGNQVIGVGTITNLVTLKLNGIIFSLLENKKVILYNKYINLLSIIEISNNLFIASGILYENGIHKLYFITFNKDISLINDLSDFV